LGCCGEGGAIITNDIILYHMMQKVRNHGPDHRNGTNGRMMEVVAASLIEGLKHLNYHNNMRRAIAHHYFNYIGNPRISFVQNENEEGNNYHLFVIRVDDNKRFIEYMKEKGIECRIHYPYCLSMMINAMVATKQVVSLPMYPELLSREADIIVDAVNEYKG
jgi:dTDP-4-amino-4,6-dideoxygalactose transaminase